MERRTFLAAGQTFTELVRKIPPEAWDQPGLGSWDVRALVGHTTRGMTTLVDNLARPAPTEEVTSAAQYFALVHASDPALHEQVAQRGVEMGARLGSRPALGVTQVFEDVTMALMTVAAAQDPLITTILGGMRLTNYLQTRTLELTVHSLDVSDAVGLPIQITDEVMGVVLDVLIGTAATNGQGAELIRAMSGRRPLSESFTVL